MKNPWTKKNPFMSMWLSGANAVMGRARGQATAAAQRETKAATTRGIGSVLNFWTKAATGAAAPTPTSVPVKAKRSAMAGAAGAASTVAKKAAGKKTPAKKTAASRARKKRK
ncbi:MAG: hypothetical protein ABI212_05945 [Burkholderiaceae bacterium]